MNPKLTEAIRPWYRHPWPWILMSGPFVVVVAGVLTAYLAVVSNDGLVDDDYYKQGLAINQETARDQVAVQRGLQAEVMQNAETRQIRILLQGNPGIALPQELKLRIAHPTRAGVDQRLLLQAEGAGTYSGKLSAALVGRWHISLEDENNEWRLSGDWVTEKTPSLRLPTSAR
jgi:uncharacterized protein